MPRYLPPEIQLSSTYGNTARNEGADPAWRGGEATDDLLVFSADMSQVGAELFAFDPESGSTCLVDDFLPGPSSSFAREATALDPFGRRWVLSARVHENHVQSSVVVLEFTRQPRCLPEPVDGTMDASLGSPMLRSSGSWAVLPAAGPRTTHSLPSPGGFTVAFASTLLFSDSDPHIGTELWTVPLADLDMQRIRSSSSSSSGTARAAAIDINPGGDSSSPAGFAIGDPGIVAFEATTAARGRELWVLRSGSLPEVLFEPMPGPESSSPRILAAWRGHLLVSAFAGEQKTHGVPLDENEKIRRLFALPRKQGMVWVGSPVHS